MKTVFDYIKWILILFICVAGPSVGSAQTTLLDLLKEKNTYNEIVSAIDTYYMSQDINSNRRLFSQYKRWKRWEWFTGIHLDASARPVNYSQRNLEEFKNYFSIREDEFSNEPFGQSRSNSGSWVSIGPNTVTEGVARVDRLVFHPTDPNTIYACTPAGGVFRTFNGGTNWHALNGFLPNIGVSGMVIDKDNANTMYLLTGDGDSFIPNGGFVFGFGYIRPSMGILKSLDGGNTWFKLSDIGSPTPNYYGYKLIQLNDFHWVFFACTSKGLYRSYDYGQTWTQDPTIGTQEVFDIEDAGSGYMYVATKSNVYRSTSWGGSFSQIPSTQFSTQPSGNTERTSIAICPSSPNSLYVLFGGSNPDLLYRSDNNGNDFTLVNNNAPPTQHYMAALVVRPDDINTILIGDVLIQRSTNGGGSFTQVGSNVHADVHDFQYNPLNNNLYLGCDGGVYRSQDHGQNWTSLLNGLQASQFYHMTGFNGSDSLVLGCAQDNGILQSANSGITFRLEWGGDGFESKYLNNNNNFCFSIINTSVRKIRRTPLFSWDKTPAGATGWYPSIAIHPQYDTIIYAGYNNGVFRSLNDGTSWVNKGNSGSANGKPAGGLAVSGQAPDRIYAANDITVWRSDNRGDDWDVISSSPGFPSINSTTPITDITTRTNNADEIWVTIGGYSAGVKVYYSNNSGTSWINLSGSLPNIPVYAVKYSGEGDAYIGTDIGVFFMDFTMNDWVPFSNGLPLVPVTDIFINESTGTLRASTFGRGIWASDLYSDCGPFLLLSGVTNGRNFYQSNGFIETSQIIPGSIGNELRLRSPVKLIFEDGFKIHYGAYMHGIIGNCGQGVFNFSAPGNEKTLSKSEFLKIELATASGKQNMSFSKSHKIEFLND